MYGQIEVLYNKKKDEEKKIEIHLYECLSITNKR
jgi:hypothetical protein